MTDDSRSNAPPPKALNEAERRRATDEAVKKYQAEKKQTAGFVLSNKDQKFQSEAERSKAMEEAVKQYQAEKKTFPSPEKKAEATIYKSGANSRQPITPPPNGGGGGADHGTNSKTMDISRARGRGRD